MKSVLFLFTIVMAVILPGCQTTREMPPAMALYGPQSDFIFLGLIKVLHTSTIDAQDAEAMGVVQVNDIIKTPSGLEQWKGKDITVRFMDINSKTRGQELILFTNVMYVGNEMAVAEVGNMNHDPEQNSMEDLRTDANEVMKKQQEDNLKAAVQKAEVIVSAKVTRTAMLKPAQNIDTEHDPMWTEAFIEVDETMKGKSDQTMSFVFAASMDVAWYMAPKFKEGDQGVFLLRRNESLKEMRDRFSIVDRASFYTDKETIEQIKKIAKQ